MHAGTRRLSLPHNKLRTALLRMVNASYLPLPELNGSFKALSTFDLVSHWILPRYTTANNVHLQNSHAWSFMSENDVARKLEKLGLILNRHEPALICSRCKYALQPSGVRVSRHLAERPCQHCRGHCSYYHPKALQTRSDGSRPSIDISGSAFDG